MLKRYISLLFTTGILSVAHLLSQPTLEWERIYPDSNTFIARPYSLVLDDSCNVYITGHAETGIWNAYTTIKYNTNGIQKWVINYYGETSGGRYPYSIAVDKQYNVYVTGYSHRNNTSFDFCTIKYNSEGVEKWVRYYDGPNHYDDEARQVAVDNAGNIYVSGFSELCQYSCCINVTIKYSSNGDLIWLRTYGTSGNGSDVTDMKIDENCNAYITGWYDTVAVTIKYDSSGNQLWANTFRDNGGTFSESNALTLDKDRNIIITGDTRFSIFPNYRKSFTIKYLNNGIKQWAKSYNPVYADMNEYWGSKVITDESNNVYVAGLYYSSTLWRVYTFKYSQLGDSIWNKTSEDTASPPYTSIDMNKDINANIYIASIFFKSNRNQIGILKYDSSGLNIWKEFTNYNNYNSEPASLKIDSNRNIYLTGRHGTQMVTFKYAQVVGINNNHEQIAERFKLQQNYPNPFNPKTKINYELHASCYVKLSVYDATGKEIGILVNKNQGPGLFQVDFEGTNYSTGIYFYTLYVDGSFVDARKMLLIK